MDNLIGHIYILVFPSGKRYVGQTIQTIAQRIWQHWHPSKREYYFPVHNAMRRYGRGNVNIEYSFPIYGEQKDLDAAEDKYILQHDTLVPNGYNLMRGGRGGAKSEETKAKISMALTGRHPSEESKVKVSVALTGRFISEETRAKMSAAHRGKTRSPQTRAKISAANILAAKRKRKAERSNS